MDKLFAVLSLVSFVAIIVGLIKPSLLRQTSRLKAVLLSSAGVIVFFVLFAVTDPNLPKASPTTVATTVPAKTSVAITPKPTPVTTPIPVAVAPTPTTTIVPPPVKATTPVPTAPAQTNQLAFEKNLSENVAEQNSAPFNTTQLTYRDFEINTDMETSDPARPLGAKAIIISIDIGKAGNMTTELQDTGKLTAKLFQTSFKSYLAPYDVLVWYYADTIDQYGNKGNTVVITYSIDKDTYNKVNWANFDAPTLCTFLQQQSDVDDDGPVCTHGSD